jgi:hypothetical protein
MIFANSKLKSKEWYFMIYTFLRFNTSIHLVEAEPNLSYRTLRGHVDYSGELPDALTIILSGPVETDEAYVSTGAKGRARMGTLRGGAART